MDSKFDDKDVITLLARYEQTIGALYKAYAIRFPDYKAFWDGIASEEAKHARLLRSLLPEIKEGLLILNVDNAKLTEISEMLSRVRAQIDNCENGEESVANSLDVALSIESTLLEIDISAFLAGKNKLFNSVVEILQKDTSRHRKEIKRICEALARKL